MIGPGGEAMAVHMLSLTTSATAVEGCALRETASRFARNITSHPPFAPGLARTPASGSPSDPAGVPAGSRQAPGTESRREGPTRTSNGPPGRRRDPARSCPPRPNRARRHPQSPAVGRYHRRGWVFQAGRGLCAARGKRSVKSPKNDGRIDRPAHGPAAGGLMPQARAGGK